MGSRSRILHTETTHRRYTDTTHKVHMGSDWLIDILFYSQGDHMPQVSTNNTVTQYNCYDNTTILTPRVTFELELKFDGFFMSHSLMGAGGKGKNLQFWDLNLGKTMASPRQSFQPPALHVRFQSTHVEYNYTA